MWWRSGLRICYPMPVLSLLCLRSLLWCRFDPWPRNLSMPQVQPKKKKKLVKRVALFSTFAHLFNIWLHRRQQDSPTCFCTQPVAICHFGGTLCRKFNLMQLHGWEGEGLTDLLEGSQEPQQSSEHTLTITNLN